MKGAVTFTGLDTELKITFDSETNRLEILDNDDSGRVLAVAQPFLVDGLDEAFHIPTKIE